MNANSSGTINQKAFRGEASLAEMIDLARRFPEQHLHTIDLPYRLSSWALDEPENAVLWVAGSRLASWAVLQAPFWALDFAVDPGLAGKLLPQVLVWADGRAAQVARTRFGRPSWYCHIFRWQEQLSGALQTAGFASQEDMGEDSWRKVWMERPGKLPVPKPVLPEGFLARLLSGENEVEAYVALHRLAFGTDNMTPEWRRRTLLQPEYRAELDLVVEAPGGALAAFCIAWLDPTRQAGQIEPLGVHPEYRQQGLGLAILGEALQRLHALGAQMVYVETDLYREPALSLYLAAGFQIQDEVVVYRKDFTSG